MALQEELEVQGNYLFRYRGVLPVIILLVAILIFSIPNQHYPTLLVSSGYEFFCLGISLIGLGIRVFAVAFRFKGTSGRNTKKQVADNLNTSGVYSQLRHPLYLGNFFMSLGIAMLIQSLWFMVVFVVVYWIYYERIMYAEEQFLRKQFGEKYLRWAAATPAIIPAFRNWVKPQGSVNWKGTMRNEINSVLSLFLVFLVLEAIEKAKEGRLSDIFSSWTFYSTLISILLYAWIKLIPKVMRKVKASAME